MINNATPRVKRFSSSTHSRFAAIGLAAVVVGGLCVRGYAQESDIVTTTSGATASETVAAPQDTGASLAETRAQNETISLNVDNQEIRVILRNIADIYELNIVIPDELQGTASLNLRDVTWQQIFDIVLAEAGYSWRDEDGIIRIRMGTGDSGTAVDPRVTIRPDGLIDVDFRSATVGGIVSAIGRSLDLNVVMKPDPILESEMKDFRLKGVTWQQAMNAALNAYAFGYEDNEGVLTIKSLAEINAVPDVSRVFQVKYSEASSIATLLEKQAGVTRVVTDSRSNVIILTGQPARMGELKTLIDTLDRPTPQVMIESRFIEVAQNDVKNLGVNWASLAAYDVSAGPFEREFVKRVSEDDQIEAKNSDNMSYTTGRDGNSGATSVNQVESTINRLKNLVDNTASQKTDTAIFSADAFSIVLSALSTNTNSKIVANPTVVSLNGEEAKIEIVDHYYMQEAGTVSNGVITQGNIIKLDPLPGIALSVTPTISGGDFISLKVEPQVNNQVGEQEFNDTFIPVVRQRTALTHVMVKDRETLAIGGLVDETTRKITNKVPLLGSIPLVGRAFRHDSDTVMATNQLIFITASILNPNETNYVELVGRDRLNNLGLSDRDIQGTRYQLPPEEEALHAAILKYRTQVEAEESQSKLNQQIEAFQSIEMKKAEKAAKEAEKRERAAEKAAAKAEKAAAKAAAKGESAPATPSVDDSDASRRGRRTVPAF